MRERDFFFLKEGGECLREIFTLLERNGRQKRSGEKLRKAGRRGRKSKEGDCISLKEKKRIRVCPIGITQF